MATGKQINLLDKYKHWHKSSVTNYPTCLAFKATQPKDKTIPGRPWESMGVDIFTINNKHYLYIVDRHSELLVIIQVDGFIADNLIFIYLFVILILC